MPLPWLWIVISYVLTLAVGVALGVVLEAWLGRRW